jgi:hypothetical protein
LDDAHVKVQRVIFFIDRLSLRFCRLLLDLRGRCLEDLLLIYLFSTSDHALLELLFNRLLSSFFKLAAFLLHGGLACSYFGGSLT